MVIVIGISSLIFIVDELREREIDRERETHTHRQSEYQSRAERNISITQLTELTERHTQQQQQQKQYIHTNKLNE